MEICVSKIKLTSSFAVVRRRKKAEKGRERGETKNQMDGWKNKRVTVCQTIFNCTRNGTAADTAPRAPPVKWVSPHPNPMPPHCRQVPSHAVSSTASVDLPSSAFPRTQNCASDEPQVAIVEIATSRPLATSIRLLRYKISFAPRRNLASPVTYPRVYVSRRLVTRCSLPCTRESNLQCVSRFNTSTCHNYR